MMIVIKLKTCNERNLWAMFWCTWEVISRISQKCCCQIPVSGWWKLNSNIQNFGRFLHIIHSRFLTKNSYSLLFEIQCIGRVLLVLGLGLKKEGKMHVSNCFSPMFIFTDYFWNSVLDSREISLLPNRTNRWNRADVLCDLLLNRWYEPLSLSLTK